MSKPTLDKDISLEDFNDFYWLKEELTTFCKAVGIQSSGSKMELTQKIQYYLSTGETPPTPKKENTAKSKFDWNNEPLSNDTIITDNYKNTENVRAFFVEQIGPHFSFNVAFMDWMKQNQGKTLNDAVQEWERIRAIKKDKNHKTEIGVQFEYNRYMRAFLSDNPNLTSRDAMKFWKLKSSQRGTHEYEKSDLNLE